MNRKFIGYSDMRKLVETASKKVTAAMSEYSQEMTSRLFGTATKKVAKVGTSKKEVVGQF
jgi:hypothetical protein